MGSSVVGCGQGQLAGGLPDKTGKSTSGRRGSEFPAYVGPELWGPHHPGLCKLSQDLISEQWAEWLSIRSSMAMDTS